ncbi:MAG: GHKL domain-containing protein [Ruminococcus flavefaciens]|nr:GHKL domain-containing protein [Ruminococcus flavefaciens]
MEFNNSVEYISYIMMILFTPFMDLLFIRCFYNGSIKITKSKIILYFLSEIILIITPFPFGVYLLRMAVPVVIFSDIENRNIKYYIKNFIGICIADILLDSSVAVIADIILEIILHAEIIDDKPVNIVQFTLSTILEIIVILWIYIEFIRKQITLKMRIKDTVAFAVYYAYSMYCTYTISFHAEYWSMSKLAYASIRMFTIFTLILIPVMIVKNRKSAYYNELSTRNEQFLEMQLATANAYRQSQEDTRAFRHDMGNNLIMVSAMMKKKEYGQAEEYVNSLSEKLSSFSPKIVTGDSMLDSLLSSKLPVIEEKSIKFDTSGIIDGGLNWKPIDVCAVFANLIDNAIEACEKVEVQNRYIKFNIRKTDYQYIITLHNSVAQLVECSQINGNSQYTSKSDKSYHGFGMKNIRNTLEKYNAVMQIECTDTEFTTQIIIIK